MLEEIKHKSSRAMMEASSCPTEDEDKDLLESNSLKTVANLQKYRAEMKASRHTEV
jgi:hypothetical protein